MKAIYLLLNDLKRVDEKVQRLKNELEEIPREISGIEQEIEKSLAAFSKVKQQQEEMTQKARKAEQELKEKEDFLRKAESKMMEVKTNEEYQAAQKENDTHRTEKEKLEEQLLGLMSESESFKTMVLAAEKAHLEKEKDLNQKKEILQGEGKSLLKAFEELLEKRKGEIERLDPSTRAVYEKACAAVKGVAIAKIDRGLCCSCNVKIRPQLYNEVLGFKAIHRCPNCNRLLVAPVDETEGSVTE